MTWTNYLFSFRGRINRAKLWLFILILFGVEIVLITVFAGVFGISAATVAAAQGNASSVLFGGGVAIVSFLACMAIVVVLFIAGIALTVKRLHDRNKSAAWLLVFWLGPLLLEIIAIGTTRGEPGQSNPIAAALILAAFGISVWAFVELYCLRGTVGDNRFGADPLALKT